MLYTLTEVTPETLAQIDEEKKVRRTTEIFLLFGLGSQFDRLIKLALEKLGVFCLVVDPAKITAADVRKIKPTGIILSGGPASAHTDPPPFDQEIFDIGIPVLGICLGFQMWARHRGITVAPAKKHEYGIHDLTVYRHNSLFANVPESTPVLESHRDCISQHNTGLTVLGSTDNAPVAAGNYEHLWGVQFHPEVTQTTSGPQIFENFCFGICGAEDRYQAEDVAKQKIAALQKQIGNKKVLLALSGGSDSSVLAHLLKDAMKQHPGNLRAVYIEGIDRPDDKAHVEQFFAEQPWLDVVFVDATEQFLAAVEGLTDMHAKRVAMREVYKDVLEAEIKKFGADFIAQGSLYTDICESGGGHDSGATKATIKLHHNVGLGFSVPELTPLDDCFKDSARQIGREIGVPEDLLTRHPFPGPGLLVRIDEAVDRERLATARQIDDIYIEELRRWELYDTIWQAGAVVTNSVVTCTKGDGAAKGVVVCIWAVLSVDGFTAKAAELPWEFLKRVSQRITNEVPTVGCVVYRISDKPPATIEWG